MKEKVFYLKEIHTTYWDNTIQEHASALEEAQRERARILLLYSGQLCLFDQLPQD